MIVTLTLNPAVDKIILVKRLDVGEVNRVKDSQLDAGGKGVNVSRMADRLGRPTIAFGFLAGEMGSLVERKLADEGVQYSFHHVTGQTRLNVTIFDQKSSRGTSFYERGPRVGRRELEALTRDIKPWLLVCKVLVLGGSLPPGVPDDVYAHFIRLAREAGAKTILDTSGEALRLGIGAKPTLIKPNVEEAEQLVGHSLPDVGAMVEAARSILTSGVETVVISMAESGAIMAHGDDVWHAVPPAVTRLSAIGSGDSMVAGLAMALARGDDPVEGLRLGTAAGAATAMAPGTLLGSPDDVKGLLSQVRIERIV